MLLLWLVGLRCRSASVFELQHDRQLALFPDWTAGDCSAWRILAASHCSRAIGNERRAFHGVLCL